MADANKYVAVKETTLTAGMTSTEMSFTVATVEDRAGNTLTMTDFGTTGFGVFEPGTAKEEHFTFIGISATTITIGERGLAMKSPYTNVPANQKSHSAGNQVILYSNTPRFFDELSGKDNDETITGIWTFTNPNYPRMDSATPAPVDDEEFATKKYADDLAIAGSPDATQSVKGIVEIATDAELASGAASGSGDTTADLVAHAASHNETAAAGKVPVAESTSKLGQDWVGLTTAGDLVKSDGTDLQRFPVGTGDQYLKVNAGGTDIEYGGDNLEEANTFFDGATDQNTKLYVTAGQAMTAGDIAAVESDGKVYRTNVNDFSTENAVADISINGLNASVKEMFTFNTSDNTDKVLVYVDDNSTGTEQLVQVIYDADRKLYSSDVNVSINFSAFIPANLKAIELTTDQIVVESNSGATSEVIAISGLNASVSQGSPVSIPTGNGRRALALFSSTHFITFTGTTTSGAGIQTHKCTLSGNTITVEAVQAFFSTTNNVETIIAAKRFGTTDFYAVTYRDETDNAHRIIIGEYNDATGAWTSVGTPVTFATNITSSDAGNLQPFADSDTQLAYFFTNGTSRYAGVISRSGTVPTVGSLTSTAQRDTPMSVSSLGRYTYAMGLNDSGFTDAVVDIMEADEDGSSFAVTATQHITGSADDGCAAIAITPARLATFYEDGAGNTETRTIDLTTNYEGLVGIIESDVANAATAAVVHAGTDGNQSGLTAGTKYYTGFDGQPQSDSEAAEFIGPAISATKILKS